MDPTILAVLVLLLVFAAWRFRRTHRQAKTSKDQEIRSRLEELRKKRDEHRDGPIV